MRSGDSANFMQFIPSYEVKWERPNGNVQRLECAEDDLQAVLRSVIRTEPTSKITIEQADTLP